MSFIPVTQRYIFSIVAELLFNKRFFFFLLLLLKTVVA